MSVDAINGAPSSAGFEPVFAMTPQRSPAFLRLRDEVGVASQNVGKRADDVVMGIAAKISNAHGDGLITMKEAQTLMRQAENTINRKSQYGGEARPAMIAGLNNIANTKSTWPIPSPGDARRDAAKELLRDVFGVTSK